MNNEIEKLQEANKELKTQARNIMSLSNDVSSVLKTKQLDDIEHSLKAYETALENAETFINEKMCAITSTVQPSPTNPILFSADGMIAV